MPLRLAILLALLLPLGCVNSIDRMHERLAKVRMGHDEPKDVLRQWIKALRNDTVQPEAYSVATTSVYINSRDPDRQAHSVRLQGLLVQEAFAGRATLRLARKKLGQVPDAALAMPVLTDGELDRAEARLEAAEAVASEKDRWAAFDLSADQSDPYPLRFSPLHRKATVVKFNRAWFIEPTITFFPDGDFAEGGDAAERLHQLQRAGLVQYRLANGDIASLDQLNRELSAIFGPGVHDAGTQR